LRVRRRRGQHPQEDAGHHPPHDIQVTSRRQSNGTTISSASRSRSGSTGEGPAGIDLSIEKYCSVIHSLNPDIPETYELTLAE
jgi:hypothetical protein